MTAEKMAETLARLRKRKKEFNAQIDKRISALEKEYELAVAASTQRAFTKYRIEPNELVKLKYASKEQLKKVLEFIDSEIEIPPKEKEPEKPVITVEKKETNEYAKNNLT